MSEVDLVDEFKKVMNEKSYLVVLGDLSSMEEWDQIKICFPKNKNGSRIGSPNQINSHACSAKSSYQSSNRVFISFPKIEPQRSAIGHPLQRSLSAPSDLSQVQEKTTQSAIRGSSFHKENYQAFFLHGLRYRQASLYCVVCSPFFFLNLF